MDENRNENIGEDFSWDKDFTKRYDTPDPTSAETEANGYENAVDGSMEKTQEMDSVQFRNIEDERGGITPREEFTELNSAEDDMSKTLCMEAIGGEEYTDEPVTAQNPIRRRSKKKRKKINHVRTMGQVFLGAVLSVAAIGVGVWLSVKVIAAARDITGMSKDYTEIDLEITEDMGVNEIVDSLYQHGIIEMPSLMKMYINFTDNENGFLNGPHTVNSNMSYNNILTSLKNEKEYTKTIEVVIPEGLTVADIGKLLEENYVCRAVDFEAAVRSKLNKYDFEESLPNSDRLFMMEGYLFPDTYEFYVVEYLEKNPNYNTRTWADEAAAKMMSNFDDHITKKMKNRMKELNMTLDDTIKLASLIQREANTEENMALVSSVFHNRLADPENFPKLQSDVTRDYVQNCITPRITAANSAQMKKLEETYDTYNCVGLPAGPICNPGVDAINAALYPEETSYYFFLAARDGTFYWAQTQEQHDQNIIDADLHWQEEQSNGTNGQ